MELHRHGTMFVFPMIVKTLVLASERRRSTVVGVERSSGPPSGGVSFIWRDGVSMVSLTEYVPGLGIATQGLVLSLPLGISEDGRMIVGAGRPEDGFGIVPWVVTIPTPGALAVLGLGGLVATRRRR